MRTRLQKPSSGATSRRVSPSWLFATAKPQFQTKDTPCDHVWRGALKRRPTAVEQNPAPRQTGAGFSVAGRGVRRFHQAAVKVPILTPLLLALVAAYALRGAPRRHGAGSPASQVPDAETRDPPSPDARRRGLRLRGHLGLEFRRRAPAHCRPSRPTGRTGSPPPRARQQAVGGGGGGGAWRMRHGSAAAADVAVTAAVRA